jgi:hypothetical protein
LQSPRITDFDGDTLTVYDSALQRASRFTTDGLFLDSFRQMNGGRPSVLVARGDLLIGIIWEGQRVTNTQYARPRALITKAATGDTVAIVRGEFVPESRITDLTEPGGTYRGRLSALFFGGSPAMVITHERDIVLARGDEPLIQVFSPLGELRLRIRIVQPERPIDAGFRNRYFAYLDSLATAEDRQLSEDARQRLVFADRVGFSTSMCVDGRGWLWLRDVWGNVLNWASDTAWWHVVDAEGCYQGRAYLPGRLFAAMDGLLMSTRYDEETGEEIPIVYRIVPAVAGLRYP